MPTTQWFLTSRERGNPATRLDSRHHADVAWTEGNLVRPLIHGTAYFAAEENRQLGDEINDAGGQCLLDMRVRTGGHTTVRATTVVRVVIVTDQRPGSGRHTRTWQAKGVPPEVMSVSLAR